MNLVKTSVYSGISTIVRIFTSFVINKLIALYIGPGGLAVMGNFQNAVNILSGLSTCSINSGVVKYTAEYADDPIRTKSLFSTSTRITAISSAIIGIVSICASSSLANRILHNATYGYLFILLGLTVFLYSLHMLVLSILNGKKEIRKFTIINILASLLSLLLTSILIYFKQLEGAILSLVITQSCFFFLSFYFISRASWFSISMFKGKMDKEVVRNLFRYSAMGITSAVMGPFSLLLIRNLITRTVSAEGAGYWEGITRISSNYLMLVTTTLSIYYLPKLSETRDHREVRTEIANGYKIIMPVLIISSALIYLCRNQIIQILFSHQFQPMESLFLFQMLGDVIKIGSWLLAFLMLAKAMARMFIITEIVFNLTYVLLSFFFVNQYGLIGATYAYAVNYLLYFITCYLLIRKRFEFPF